MTLPLLRHLRQLLDMQLAQACPPLLYILALAAWPYFAFFLSAHNTLWYFISLMSYAFRFPTMTDMMNVMKGRWDIGANWISWFFGAGTRRLGADELIMNELEELKLKEVSEKRQKGCVANKPLRALRSAQPCPSGCPAHIIPSPKLRVRGATHTRPLRQRPKELTLPHVSDQSQPARAATGGKS
ncbi:hypothetical protein EJ02DRAFT_463020 [Clathrospora elynae]|uniref:Uncharacterized protein n=1 Tax=Clathrospora elynae TaxID=706981 RepID=A0A6A5T0N0_9PLEO|nr:hypothetical protein EJ02DRAFT_463020 [Clathrospora elynae]